jgi:ParB family transcriptional regulator, chromosome partitioning protein
MGTVRLADIEPNPNQPRKVFDKLEELAENIKQVGLKEPLEVRPLPNGKYQLVDGERRYRACKLVPLEDVPVKIREDIKTDEEAALESFIINEERSNYSSQDKDAYIFHLYETTKLSTRKLAEKLGKHHSYVDHALEAHHFRQKMQELAPTQVGTLQFTHSALKNTAMIKDDKLRIRVLQAIQDKKIKSDYETVAYVSDLLAAVPQEAVREAFFLGLFTIPQLATIADISHKDKEFMDATSEAFSGHIPKEIKRDVIHGYPYLQAALEPKVMQALIKDEAERKEAWLQRYIQEHPERKKKDILRQHKLETYDWKEEFQDFVKGQFMEFKKKYERDGRTLRDGATGIRGPDGFWKDVFYWMMQLLSISKTRGLDDDLRIAIIDAVYSFDLREALRTSVAGDEHMRRAHEVEESWHHEINVVEERGEGE